jgi:hypothetical protein
LGNFQARISAKLTCFLLGSYGIDIVILCPNFPAFLQDIKVASKSTLEFPEVSQ